MNKAGRETNAHLTMSIIPQNNSFNKKEGFLDNGKERGVLISYWY